MFIIVTAVAVSTAVLKAWEERLLRSLFGNLVQTGLATEYGNLIVKGREATDTEVIPALLAGVHGRTVVTQDQRSAILAVRPRLIATVGHRGLRRKSVGSGREDEDVQRNQCGRGQTDKQFLFHTRQKIKEQKPLILNNLISRVPMSDTTRA